ncbi:MAG: hypothetical protein P8J87_06530 [Verrucomicrobiales bacterium]|nr:hypothetical protein [Verrucomicrobiales bacterium]
MSVSGLSHERITVGPDGGRLIVLDSVATPNVEFTAKGGRGFWVGLMVFAKNGVGLDTICAVSFDVSDR